MKEEKDPKSVTLDQLITKRIFQIPNFQRAYSWTEKQRDQLFEDIKIALQKKSQHFMSTIVVSLNNDSPAKIGIDTYECVTVVDGQQRITTLLIYLKVLSNYMCEIEELKAYGEKLQDRLDLEKKSEFILLQTNHNTNDIFKNLMQLNSKEIPKVLKKAKTNADKNLIDAYEESFKSIKNIIEISDNNVDTISALYNTVLEKLKFIVYFVDSEEENYRLFEVLNDRGLTVSDLDKAKSILMGIVYNTSDENETIVRKERISNIYSKWMKIYELIGVNEIVAPFSENEILQFASLLFAKKDNSEINYSYISKIPTSSESLEIIRKYCVDFESVLKFTEILVRVTEVIKETSKKLKDINYSYKLYPCLQIQHSRFLNTVINYKKLELSKYYDYLIEHWEKIVIFNFYIECKTKKIYLSPYINFAFNIYEDKDLFKSFANFTEKVLDYTKKDVKDIKDKLRVREIKSKDFHWKWVNYLLLNYESNIKDTDIINIINNLKINDYKSTIEHIHSQTNLDNKICKFTHYIGNLTLVPNGINSQLSNKQFIDKVKIYKSLKDDFPSFKNIIKKTDWNEEAIEERTEEILKFIDENWLKPYSKDKIELIIKK